MAEAGSDSKIAGHGGRFGALAFSPDSHHIDGVKAEEPNQPFCPECHRHSFGDENAVATCSIGEVA
ncbi:uncharacterized protein STAUR_2998 [Stigmatella aurantiaca DW4/3-1]|uniref:Uncharacterized protein n=1 Tax=Stigmatella aurantiaca (strain DW4/3-1) TaxID=378806 RepID=E3FS67_STIAD|nr:uncharacterized protein STAUR_2998 [Stigmatella aurantiaca DW4/3-1]